MLTYDDLVVLGEDDKRRIDFVLKAISEHRQSREYRIAKEAAQYYSGLNPTIRNYEKLLYDLSGKAHVDMWTANHKIASAFFTFVIDQEVSYLLGNGIRFGKDETKDKLGKDFDEEVMDALEYARIGGVSYGFWNLDHVEVYKATEFKPLYSEEDGFLKAGVRWWQLDEAKPLRATLFEPDGFTQYIKPNGEDMRIYKPKRPYIIRTVRTDAEGEINTDGENYAGFPVVPLYANKEHQSALIGKRNTIDALDLASSNMVNGVDEGNLIYWVLTNAGGMDDLDDVKFLERIKTIHVAHADGDAGATAVPHTIEAPFEGTKVTIDMLKDRLFDDFQAFDAQSMSANDMSATAIRAGYVRLDMKTDKIERQVTRFVDGILAIAGIDDEPAYERNRIVNTTEETQRVIMQAPYFDDEYIRKKLLTINGDIDLFEEISERIDSDDYERLSETEQGIRSAGDPADRE